MTKTQSSAIRLLIVLLGIGLVGCGGHSLRGRGGSTCFNFVTPSPALVPFNQRLAVSSSPLDRSSSPAGYINGRERVTVSQVCEGTAGSDYKITTAGGLEGYVPAQLLVPRSLVPGSKITVRSRMAIYDDLRDDPQSYSKMWQGGDAVIVEGPATARGGFIGYKIRTLDSPSVTGWIPAWALDSVSPMAYYGIRAIGDEGNTTASESSPVENSAPASSWSIPRWLMWVLGLVVMMLIAALLSRGKAPSQRITILVYCMAVAGFGALGYELWQGAYITGVIILVVMAIVLAAARAGGEAGVQAAAVQKDSDYEKAEYGIPHCNFEQTANGFTVTFYRPPAALDTSPAIVGALGAVFLMIGWAIFGGTKIEVTKEAVTIGRKKLKRTDFGGFLVDHTFKLPDKTLAVLGYSYGRRSFPFGGTWPEGDAAEVAAALNLHLRDAPLVENETRVSQEQLRNTRSTDF